jgi:hypothetical protein
VSLRTVHSSVGRHGLRHACPPGVLMNSSITICLRGFFPSDLFFFLKVSLEENI